MWGLQHQIKILRRDRDQLTRTLEELRTALQKRRVGIGAELVGGTEFLYELSLIDRALTEAAKNGQELTR